MLCKVGRIRSRAQPAMSSSELVAKHCPCVVCGLAAMLLAWKHRHSGPGTTGFCKLIPSLFLQSNPNTLEFTEAAEKALGFRDMAVSFSSDMCCIPCLPGSSTVVDEFPEIGSQCCLHSFARHWHCSCLVAGDWRAC